MKILRIMKGILIFVMILAIVTLLSIRTSYAEPWVVTWMVRSVSSTSCPHFEGENPYGLKQLTIMTTESCYSTTTKEFSKEFQTAEEVAKFILFIPSCDRTYFESCVSSYEIKEIL